MSGTPLSKEQIATGYDRFLAQHPQGWGRINALTQELADILGVDLGTLRRDEAAKALSEAAANSGVDGFEYLLRFAVDTASEWEQILQARRESVEMAIGLK